LLKLLVNFWVNQKKFMENTSQVSWNCPVCDEGGNKGNLEVNIEKSLFHCWSCGDYEGTHGSLGRIFDKLRE
jgi:hypothetical protein